ncbi:MAG: hypothetical protein V3V74_07075 [Nitrosomonadaceae bacterium]
MKDYYDLSKMKRLTIFIVLVLVTSCGTADLTQHNAGGAADLTKHNSSGTPDLTQCCAVNLYYTGKRYHEVKLVGATRTSSHSFSKAYVKARRHTFAIETHSRRQFSNTPISSVHRRYPAKKIRKIERPFSRIPVDCKLGKSYYVEFVDAYPYQYVVHELPNETLNPLQVIAEKIKLRAQKKKDAIKARELEKAKWREQRRLQVLADLKKQEEKRLEKIALNEAYIKEEKLRKANLERDRVLAIAKEKKRVEEKKAYRKKHPFTCSVEVSPKIKPQYKKELAATGDELQKSLNAVDLFKGYTLHNAEKYCLGIRYEGKALVCCLEVSDFKPNKNMASRGGSRSYLDLNALLSYVKAVDLWAAAVRDKTKNEDLKLALHEPIVFIVLNRKVKGKKEQVTVECKIDMQKYAFKDSLIYSTDKGLKLYKTTENNWLTRGKFVFRTKTDLTKDFSWDKQLCHFFSASVE